VPGTELTPERRGALVRDLTVGGWLLLGGTIGFVVFQLERVRSVSAQRFAGVWDQRIEVLSFLMLPPNVVVLLPPVLAGCAAAAIGPTAHESWGQRLLRVCRRIAIAYVAIGAISIVSILLRDENAPADAEGIFLRLGGMSLAIGMALVCSSFERLAD
jgi:hypothetical protein